MSTLPVLQPPRPASAIAASKTTKWRAGVLVGFHLLIAAHIAYWVLRGSTISPVEPSEAIAFSRAGVINAGFIFFAATIVLTAIFGRFFCGWGCHLVALQDASRSLLEKFGHRPAPLRARFLGWVPTISFVYLFLYPLYHRLASGDPLYSGQTELVTTDFWGRFPGWVLALLTFFICGFAIIYFLGAKGFCTYACPYGAAFAAADRLAPMRIRVTDACEGCGHCTAVCTSNIRVHEEVRDFGMVTSPGCMKCMDCVSVCPNDALFYGLGQIPLLAKRRTEKANSQTKPGPQANKSFPLALWEEVLLAVAGSAGYLTFRGLYGAVPILMALGLAAVFAYLALLTARLAVKPHVAFKGWRLKRSGKLLPAGRAALLLLLLAHAFWGHSAFIRWTLVKAERSYAATGALRAAALDLGRAPAPEDDLRPAQRALEQYQTLVRYGFTQTLGVASRRANLLLVLNDLPQAHALAAESVRRNEFPADSAMVAAVAAAKQGQFVVAEGYYAQIATRTPDNAQAHLGRGLMLAEQGQFALAAAAFGDGLKHHPGSADLHYNRALALAYAGRLEDALEEFEAAVAIRPDHRAALENLAGTLAQLGRFEEARTRLEESIDTLGTTPSTNLLLAQILIQLGLPAEARDRLEAARLIDPNSEDVRRLLESLQED